jgi:hypothetical protein
MDLQARLDWAAKVGSTWFRPAFLQDEILLARNLGFGQIGGKVWKGVLPLSDADVACDI